jgi:hypothetical protein
VVDPRQTRQRAAWPCVATQHSSRDDVEGEGEGGGGTASEVFSQRSRDLGGRRWEKGGWLVSPNEWRPAHVRPARTWFERVTLPPTAPHGAAQTKFLPIHTVWDRLTQRARGSTWTKEPDREQTPQQ